MTEQPMESYLKCRFNFPLYPLDETLFILGIKKDLPLEEIRQRKKDLVKIRKYLIRQTYTTGKMEENENWNKLKKLSFIEFLREVGMFDTDKDISKYNELEI